MALVHVAVGGGARGALRVLRGGQALLRSAAVRAVLVSLSPPAAPEEEGGRPGDVVRWLRAAGYCVVGWWKMGGGGGVDREWVREDAGDIPWREAGPPNHRDDEGDADIGEWPCVVTHQDGLPKHYAECNGEKALLFRRMEALEMAWFKQ